MVMEDRKMLWVAGGRDYDDRHTTYDRLYEARLDGGFEVVITGAARGADLLAEQVWRDRFQLPYIGLPAQWGLYAKRAGYRRNEEIARTLPAGLLALPGGRGTQHARDLARQYDIPII